MCGGHARAQKQIAFFAQFKWELRCQIRPVCGWKFALNAANLNQDTYKNTESSFWKAQCLFNWNLFRINDPAIGCRCLTNSINEYWIIIEQTVNSTLGYKYRCWVFGLIIGNPQIDHRSSNWMNRLFSPPRICPAEDFNWKAYAASVKRLTSLQRLFTDSCKQAEIYRHRSVMQ